VAGAVLVGVAGVVVVAVQFGSPPGGSTAAPAGGPSAAVPAGAGGVPPGPACTPSPGTGPSDASGARPAIAGVAIGPVEPGTADESRDRTALQGPWTVVLRRAGGSLGRHGAVVTYPVEASALVRAVRVAGVPGRAAPGVVVWQLAGRYARVRGDLTEPELVQVAAATTVRGCLPVVGPLRGYVVVASAPYRSPSVREIRYAPTALGRPGQVLGGLIYTGITSGGGFEDQLYARGGTPAGRIGGRPAVLSGVYGGSATLAWEPAPGQVAYLGYSGAAPSAATTEALRDLAGRARPLTSTQWRASQPQIIDQLNPPS
jgi:hypothetical protein